MHNSFEHSMDHASMEKDCVKNIPMRMRMPIDFNNKSTDNFDILKSIKNLNHFVDRSKQGITQKMFMNLNQNYSLSRRNSLKLLP